MGGGKKNAWPCATRILTAARAAPAWRGSCNGDWAGTTKAAAYAGHRRARAGGRERWQRLAQAGLDALTWIGHASFLIQLGGKSALIDPVMSPAIAGFFPRNVAPGLNWPALPRIDLVLVTHNHRDHMDVPRSSGWVQIPSMRCRVDSAAHSSARDAPGGRDGVVAAGKKSKG